jgi:hypothetical protein
MRTTKNSQDIKIFQIIKWRLRGFKHYEAIEWIKRGFTLPEAIDYKRKGLDFNSVQNQESSI